MHRYRVTEAGRYDRAMGKDDVCAFCAIIAGDQPASLIHADSVAAAFLDTRPVFKGHVLVIPSTHVKTLVDLGEPGPYFARVQQLTRAVEQGLGCDGAFVAMNHRVSQSVPHLHTHIVPRHRGDGLRGFFWPRTRYTDPAEADTYAAKIRAALQAWPPPP
jgi:histidine triad (HIT) family protein